MAIDNRDFKNMFNYQEFLKEKIISDNELQKHDTFIRNIADYKNNISYINEEINKIKTILTNNDLFLDDITESDKNISFKVIYPENVESLFSSFFKQILLKSKSDEELYDKYFNIIYPDGNKRDLNTEIDVEINNLNRVHIVDSLPYICKGLGLGKKIYKELIKELKYISTNKMDRSLDSIFVWDSLRKDKNIFSFISNQNMICFDVNCDFDYINNVLLEFFKYDIIDIKNNINNNKHILDTDFREKYFNNILNTDIKLLIN